MPDVRGCHLPDELLYDVENHIWFRELDDGNVKLGMTTVATAMAGQLVAFTPKKVGRAVQAGKSCATVESGKWVGPAKSAAGGEIVAVNEDLVGKPALVNDDPYGAGWLVILKPEDWSTVKATLVPGTQVAVPYDAKMAADGFAGCACAPGTQP
jgi:glycine cleavage system H protein